MLTKACYLADLSPTSEATTTQLVQVNNGKITPILLKNAKGLSLFSDQRTLECGPWSGRRLLFFSFGMCSTDIDNPHEVPIPLLFRNPLPDSEGETSI